MVRVAIAEHTRLGRVTPAITPCPDAASVIAARKASHAQRRNKVKDRARRG
jgi:hypothetical protein